MVPGPCSVHIPFFRLLLKKAVHGPEEESWIRFLSRITNAVTVPRGLPGCLCCPSHCFFIQVQARAAAVHAMPTAYPSPGNYMAFWAPFATVWDTECEGFQGVPLEAPGTRDPTSVRRSRK